MTEPNQETSPELAEREVWAQSLERVRCDPDRGLDKFQQRLEAFKKRRDWAALPPMDIALWPGCVLNPNDVDISNPKLFNERYIELPTYENLDVPMEQRNAAHMFGRVALFFHHFAFVVTALFFIQDVIEKGLTLRNILGTLFIYGLGGGIPFLFFWILSPFSRFAKGMEKQGSARFNRQAQLVHISCGGDKVVHVPWRHVRGMVEFSAVPGSLGGTSLKLVAPRPWELEEQRRLRHPHLEEDDELYCLPYGIAAGDGRDINGALEHMEFLRRYMEKGLEAVQPDPELQRKGEIRVPGGESPATQKRREETFSLGDMIFNPIEKLIYWATFGPWLDRKFDEAYRKLDIEGFEWPEEVEAMCGPNPDLSGLDTRPIVPRKDLFYRYGAMDTYQYVDANGNPARAAIPKETIQAAKEGKIKLDIPKPSGESWTPPK
ncbi:hypothetical protein [Alloalcanivorax xenomutans]|uniref:hypothetical protein n=1 Tax=Alloalcanivorax xenomutans TaxID=1094342 RepID=UPI0009B5F3A5|nr:hypothetical protein [Alloalcanivorax xenomutans]ARB46997.1 hypothetical protein P40_17580 [Alloalcanivorax xenomutans]MCE7525951.1 hypothetical protein [Alloalcanivorax xenomutans]PHS67254.1 MAG: hypothetical protein COB00_09255 [Alcanivorax sp.]